MNDRFQGAATSHKCAQRVQATPYSSAAVLRPI